MERAGGERATHDREPRQDEAAVVRDETGAYERAVPNAAAMKARLIMVRAGLAFAWADTVRSLRPTRRSRMVGKAA